MFRPFKGVDLLPLSSVDDKGIDLVALDGPEGLFGLFQADLGFLQFSFKLVVCSFVSFIPFAYSRQGFLLGVSVPGLEIKTHEDAVRICHGADELSQRQGQLLDQGWGCDDLFPLGKDRLLVDVDHLQLIAALQVFFTDLLDVHDGLGGFGGHAGNVEA